MDAGNYTAPKANVSLVGEATTESNNTTTDDQLTTDGSHPVMHGQGFLLPTQDPQVHMMSELRLWYSAIIIPIGVLGNMLSLLVVAGKQNRGLSCNVYMGALAVTNTITLLGQGALWLTSNILLEKMTLNQIINTCTAIVYVLLSSTFAGVLIILSLLVDRVIAVTWPFKAAVLLSPRRAVITVIIICIVSLAYNSPITFSATPVDLFGQKGVRMVSSKFSTIYMISQLLFSAVLPFAAILVLNLVIVCAVKRGEKSLQTSTDDVIASASDSADVKSKQTSKVSQKERQLTIMTAVMSLCFLCLTMPKYAHQLAFSNIKWEESYHLSIAFGWSATVTQQLYVLHNAINFFLYFMTGSKFRADLRKLCRCRPNSN